MRLKLSGARGIKFPEVVASLPSRGTNDIYVQRA